LQGRIRTKRKIKQWRRRERKRRASGLCRTIQLVVLAVAGGAGGARPLLLWLLLRARCWLTQLYLQSRRAWQQQEQLPQTSSSSSSSGTALARA
jgi:hypothetical protein